MTGTISKIRQEILRVEWKIEDFLSLKSESVESPTFGFSDISWSLRVYLYNEEEQKDGIGLYLFHHDSSSSSTVLCAFGIKNTDGSLHSEVPLIWKFQGESNCGFSTLLLRSDLLCDKDEFLLEGALTLCCTLRKMQSIEAMDALSLDLKKLLVSSAQSDVTVQLKSKEYRVHRAVLAARSDVFESALKHEMLEKATGIIKIEDCDSDSFGEFLQHLYTGRADINKDNVFHLYRTADKYLVDELKSHCVAFLMENLSVDNVCEAVALAHDHNQADLGNFCQYFFCDNARSILVTSDWASLMRSHCDAATELLKHFAPTLPIKK